MVEKRRVLMICATVLVAFAAGQVMQNGNALAARFSNSGPDVVAAPTESTPNPMSVLDQSLPMFPTESLMPEKMAQPTFIAQNLVVASNGPMEAFAWEEQGARGFTTTDCAARFTALPAPGAMVVLDLAAACHPNERIIIVHAGLVFADQTDANGDFSVEVPALVENAKFEIAFSDGQAVQAQTLVLTLNGYERIALYWSGRPNLNIHAFEYGADFGSAGHVWANAPRAPQTGFDAQGGFMTLLGDPNTFNPQMAQIYSFPFGRLKTEGQVTVDVEAAVSEQTCDTTLSANTIQLSGTGHMTQDSLSLEMPKCGGESGFLVLNKLFQDLKIARN